MDKNDARIGQVLTVVAPHHGHKVTVERRDIEKHKAYWLRCECGAEAPIGEYWLDRALARGKVLAHGAIQQMGEMDAVGLMHRAEQVGE